jgi:hypothetical protein
MDYSQFLAQKVVTAPMSGFEVHLDDLHPGNFPHQNAAIRWAARLGRALLGMSFGLGKSRMQCELARLIHRRTGRPFLLICPLGVRHQFTEEDGPALGMEWQYVRTDAEIQNATTPYLITNYERVRDGDITPSVHQFAGVSLDEGDVLRSLGTKTYDIFREAFADVPVTKVKDDYSRARWQVDAHSFWRSNGNSPLTPAELYDYEAHVARLEALDRAGNLPSSWMYEPPKSHNSWVWDDIIYMRTLNTNQSQKRRENHICPLPFDIVERAIRLYSNPGDLVLDPFAGLFTVPYLAIKHGRKAMGIELNHEYFEAGTGYCLDMERQITAPTLFDYVDIVSQVEKAEAASDGQLPPASTNEEEPCHV